MRGMNFGLKAAPAVRWEEGFQDQHSGIALTFESEEFLTVTENKATVIYDLVTSSMPMLKTTQGGDLKRRLETAIREMGSSGLALDRLAKSLVELPRKVTTVPEYGTTTSECRSCKVTTSKPERNIAKIWCEECRPSLIHL